MKTIIAGSRGITSFGPVLDAIRSFPNEITEVISGMAKGVDTSAIEWAHQNNLPVKCFPAEWRKFGNSAGPIRNIEMANYADALIAVWDGKSKGTKHMISVMERQGKIVHVFHL